MKRWNIQLVTESNTGNDLEIFANEIIKVSYNRLVVDGINWDVPEELGMSFAEVEEIFQ